MHTFELIWYAYVQPKWVYEIPSQNLHEWINAMQMRFHAKLLYAWKIHVTRINVQKEPLKLEFWFESYAHLKFKPHFAMIEPYLLNHICEIHDLGLFGKGRERSSIFMLDKISFEAFLVMLSWGENLSIFGKFKL